MSGFTIVRQVAAPAERVFAVFADFARAAERIPAIEKVEIVGSGPIGKGTRIRETRVMHGVRATEELTITRYEPGEGYALSCESHGCLFTTAVLLRPRGSETTIELAFQAEARGALARLKLALLLPVMRREFEKDVDALKAAAEAPA